MHVRVSVCAFCASVCVIDDIFVFAIQMNLTEIKNTVRNSLTRYYLNRQVEQSEYHYKTYLRLKYTKDDNI